MLNTRYEKEKKQKPLFRLWLSFIRCNSIFVVFRYFHVYTLIVIILCINISDKLR